MSKNQNIVKNEEENNFNYLSTIGMLISMWFIGTKLILTVSLGYSFYKNRVDRMLLKFMFMLSWLISGLWNTIFYTLVIGLYQALLHKTEVLTTLKLIKNSGRNIVKIVQFSDKSEEYKNNFAQHEIEFAEKYKNYINMALNYLQNFQNKYALILEKGTVTGMYNKYNDVLVKVHELNKKYNFYNYGLKIESTIKFLIEHIKHLLLNLPYVGEYSEKYVQYCTDKVNVIEENYNNMKNKRNDTEELELEDLMAQMNELNILDTSDMPNIPNIHNMSNISKPEFNPELMNLSHPSKENIKKLSDMMNHMSDLNKMLISINDMSNTKLKKE